MNLLDEQEILEQEQEQEPEMTTITSAPVETTTTTLNGQTVIFNLASNDDEAGEPLPDNSENIIHQLFAELGVNLDYTPTDSHQQFTMALQFIAALWFIYWFVKMLWGIMRDFFKW